MFKTTILHVEILDALVSHPVHFIHNPHRGISGSPPKNHSDWGIIKLNHHIRITGYGPEIIPFRKIAQTGITSTEFAKPLWSGRHYPGRKIGFFVWFFFLENLL
jgi:hypothetical protein